MRYQVLLLDADDTLFDFQAGNHVAVMQLMAELGADWPTVYEDYQVHNHACWAALERGEMTQSVLRVERFRRFMAAHDVPGDPEAVADRFVELLGRQCIMLPHAVDVVRQLAEKLPLVIVTNGIEAIQRARFAKAPIRPYITRMVISEALGITKPDPRIFEAALEGIPPEKALVVGDSLRSDILGAQNAGIDACWYNPKGAALPEDIRARYIISDLRQLPEIALAD